MLILVVTLGLSITLASCNKDKIVYQCPMDCEKGKTYEEKGSCPVCKMDLNKVENYQQSNDSNNAGSGD